MPLSKAKRRAIQHLLKQRQISERLWQCCQQQFDSLSDIGRHVNQVHAAEIEDKEKEESSKLQELEERENRLAQLRQRRGEKGSSDPISIHCQCKADTSKVILFYRYVQIQDPVQFALDHQDRCANMTGKVRIASEGINATLAGSNQEIDIYLDWITTTQPFQDLKELQQDAQSLSLSDPTTPRYKFFKPSQGCLHVFSELSIKYVHEICPLGQSTVILEKLVQPNHRQGKLSPADFHALLSNRQHDLMLLDTRNYYESKIGYFEGAITPPIRKFSQFPEYIDRNKQVMDGKKILTYCTGGIRCEKATAYMRQSLSEDTEIYMLDGGIHNYLEWYKQQAKDNYPIWQGKNYVFDARQSLSLNDQQVSQSSIVGLCQQCQQPWDQYKKCATAGCHLLVLVCDVCCSSFSQTADGGGCSKVYCCHDCNQQERRGLCSCETVRRLEELKTIQV